MRNYKIVETDFKIVDNVKVYRIVALIDFNGVCAGDVGGWVSGYHNLHDNAWVSEGSVVKDLAYAGGWAKILDGSVLSENARVVDYAVIRNSVVNGRAEISGRAEVGNSIIEDNARVYGFAKIANDVKLFGNVEISGWAKILGATVLEGFTQVDSHTVIENQRIVKATVI